MATLYKYEAGGREVTYLDAEDTYSAEDVRKHWASTFPELGNATARTEEKAQTVEHEGAEVEVQKVVTFEKRAGTKGGDLALWRVSGFLKTGKGWHSWVEELVRVESAAEAEEIVLERKRKVYQREVGWGPNGVEIEVVPEDQVMRAIGASMLPGLVEASEFLAIEKLAAAIDQAEAADDQS